MKLVVAVSGGIDSVVLLDILSKQTYELIVAHVDHGIRSDSIEDEKLVSRLAQAYGATYESIQLHLGPHTSEDTARQKRYEWLRGIQHKYCAGAIATAHHQDDVIETMIINLMRGTGWRGLCSLRQHDGLVRPLLSMSRADIIRYAIEQDLSWREDSTNEDMRYLRNFVRHRFVQRMGGDVREQWLELYRSQVALEEQISSQTREVAKTMRLADGYSRYQLIMCPTNVFHEIMAEIVGERIEQPIVQQLRHFVCTAKPAKRFLYSGHEFCVSRNKLFVTPSVI